MDVSFFRQTTATLNAGNGIMTFQTPKKERWEQKSPNFFICCHLTKKRYSTKNTLFFILFLSDNKIATCARWWKCHIIFSGSKCYHSMSTRKNQFLHLWNVIQLKSLPCLQNHFWLRGLGKNGFKRVKKVCKVKRKHKKECTSV